MVGMHLLAVWAVMVTAGSSQDQAVAAARRVVHDRLAVPDSRIDLVDVEATQWPDASLGCPAKGEVYAQVITDGYRVRLRVDDRTFDVRVAGHRALICDQRAQGGEGSAVIRTRLYREARKNLAERLQVPESSIQVDFIRPKVWSDERLGCPKGPSEAASVAGVPGYLIRLSANGGTYDYHTDQSRVVICEE